MIFLIFMDWGGNWEGSIGGLELAKIKGKWRRFYWGIMIFLEKCKRKVYTN
jgi:hypothetical protein